MATQEITISELELADEVLADMTLPVDTATETRAVTLKQLRAWLGSSLPTGFIIPAVGKISDERFTLLDGKTLSRAGTYEAFCNKVVSEVQAGNWFACSEEEYAQDLLDFGQCGKFVVSNDYIRIPTITRFIGATITLSEIGKTYKESLPNIKGEYRNIISRSTSIQSSGCLSGEVTTSSFNVGGGTLTGSINTLKTNLNNYNSVYQDGAKVQPDHTKYPYYMVISTEGQTAEVGIDINKVYEDLELKANTNLSNLTAEGKSLASGLAMPSNRYIDLTWGATATSYTAPANGWFTCQNVAGTANTGVRFSNVTVGSMGASCISSTTAGTCAATIPAKKGDQVILYYNTTGTSLKILRFIYAEGEE